jgi:rubredoxin
MFITKGGNIMPGRNGTGPVGSGGGRGIRGGQGAPGTTFSAGVEGFCVCPKCGAKIPHQRAQICTTVMCPQCGTAMVRES